jgi:hypothetical protein
MGIFSSLIETPAMLACHFPAFDTVDTALRLDW